MFIVDFVVLLCVRILISKNEIFKSSYYVVESKTYGWYKLQTMENKFVYCSGILKDQVCPYNP